MSTARSLLVLCMLAACGDDDAPVAEAAPEDAAAPAIPADAAAPPDAASPTPDNKAIPLVLWVDDLLDHHTNDDSAPDTVDDKNISDDENPSTFDVRFRP